MRLQKTIRIPSSITIPIPPIAIPGPSNQFRRGGTIRVPQLTIPDLSASVGAAASSARAQVSRASRTLSNNISQLGQPSVPGKMQHLVAGIRERHANNMATLRRQPLAEVSGALGDLGTLLPLMIALALQGSISLSATLVWTGLFNVATGLFYGIPLPVQPMKAIAAAAIATHLQRRETMAAGATTATIVLVLAATGLLRRAAVWVPVPVVKGIQLGAGLSLVLSAGQSMLRDLRWDGLKDNFAYAVLAFLALLATVVAPRFPYALTMTVVGLAASLIYILATDSGALLPSVHLYFPHAHLPNLTATAAGHGLAQLPLTALNSVLAVSVLAHDLLPDSPVPSVTSLGFSVAAMNLVGCWFGAMPVCHGAGGLAAQYRFGARSGASVVLLGLAKLGLGLFLGDSLLGLLQHFPRSILGIMVVAAGLELAKVGQSLNHGAQDLWEDAVAEGEAAENRARHHTHLPHLDGVMDAVRRHRDLSEEERVERWTVMLVTTAGTIAFRNDFVGFASGMLAQGAYVLARWLRRNTDIDEVVGERGPLLGRH